MIMSKDDHAKIAAAVAAAEARTTGEIFCIVTQEVSQYREVPLAWAAAAALVIPAAVAIFALDALHRAAAPWLGGGWGEPSFVAQVAESVGGYSALQAALFALTALVVGWGPIRRAMTPRSLKRHRVQRTAYAHFASTGLAHAPDRTGVLIFASLKDRQVEIVADKAIHDAVGDPVWNAACRALVDGMKRGDAGDGFVRAIGLCGDALAQHFPADGPHDNRFSDELVEL